jgi:hypothetical protein
MDLSKTDMWINEGLEGPLEGSAALLRSRSAYRPRKAHSKSRFGCENCKKRKIKVSGS